MQPLYNDEGNRSKKLLIIFSILLVAMIITSGFLFTRNRNNQQQFKVNEMEHLQLNDEFTSIFRNISSVLKLDDELLGAGSTSDKSKLLDTKAALEKQINDGVVSIKASGTRKIPESVRLNRNNYIKLIEAVIASRSNMELLWSSVDAESRTDMLVTRLNTENKQLKSEISQLKSVAAQEGVSSRGNASGAGALQASLQKMRAELAACQSNLAKAGSGTVVSATTDDGKKAVVLYGTVEGLVAKASKENSLTMQRAYLRVSKEMLDGIRSTFPDKSGLEGKQTEIDNMLKNIGKY